MTKSKIVTILLILCFMFVCRDAQASGNKITIAATINEQDFSFPIGVDAASKDDINFEIVWLGRNNKIIGRKIQSIDDLGSNTKHYGLQLDTPDNANVVQFHISGKKNGNKNNFWSSSIEFNPSRDGFCGDGDCGDGESLVSCSRDCQGVTEISWRQLPLRNKWQSDRNIYGGEGMQMVMDIDWNEHNPNILYLVVDTTKVWKSEDGGSFWFPVAKNMKNVGGVSIVSDPNNEKVVYMAGSMCSSYTNSKYDGIYRSIDGGVSWDGPLVGTMHYQKRHAGKLFVVDHKV